MKRARRVNINQPLTDDELAARLQFLRDVERRTAIGELDELERVALLQERFPSNSSAYTNPAIDFVREGKYVGRGVGVRVERSTILLDEQGDAQDD